MKNTYYPVHVMNGYADIVIYEVLVDAGICSELACSFFSSDAGGWYNSSAQYLFLPVRGCLVTDAFQAAHRTC